MREMLTSQHQTIQQLQQQMNNQMQEFQQQIQQLNQTKKQPVLPVPSNNDNKEWLKSYLIPKQMHTIIGNR